MTKKASFLVAAVSAVGTNLAIAATSLAASPFPEHTHAEFTTKIDRQMKLGCPDPLPTAPQAVKKCVDATWRSAYDIAANMSTFIKNNNRLGFWAGAAQGELLSCEWKAKAMSQRGFSENAVTAYRVEGISVAIACIGSTDRAESAVKAFVDTPAQNRVIAQINCFNNPRDCTLQATTADGKKAERGPVLKKITPDEPRPPQREDLVIVDDPAYAGQISQYLVDSCPQSRLTTKAKKSECATAVINAPFSVGDDFATALENGTLPIDPPNALQVAEIIRKECGADLQAAIEKSSQDSKMVKPAWEESVECYDTIIEQGEDKLGISYQPTAVNTGRNVLYCLLGKPACVR